MSDLLLETVRTSGRPSREADFEVLGPISEAELVVMQEPRSVTAPALKRLTERHHALARNLAAGVPPGEAAIVCGYDISRVSILQADPSFKELLKFYRNDVERHYAGVHETLSALAKDAGEELRQRLEDDPESLSVGQLVEITKMGADRTGFGPSSKQDVNISVGIADKLQAARRRVNERKILELSALDVTPSRGPDDQTP